MQIKETIFGIGRDEIPDTAFRMMATVIRLRERLFKFSKRLDGYGIKEGDIVIDYGCGPGMYVTRASQLVGETGAVYAIDIHPLAIQAVQELARDKGLGNVKAVQAVGYTCPLKDNTADLIYALDMFHMVDNPTAFLRQIHRLLKPDGVLIIDDGHQTRSQTKSKIESSGYWVIQEETKNYLRCIPAIS